MYISILYIAVCIRFNLGQNELKKKTIAKGHKLRMFFIFFIFSFICV